LEHGVDVVFAKVDADEGLERAVEVVSVDMVVVVAEDFFVAAEANFWGEVYEGGALVVLEAVAVGSVCVWFCDVAGGDSRCLRLWYTPGGSEDGSLFSAVHGVDGELDLGVRSWVCFW